MAPNVFTWKLELLLELLAEVVRSHVLETHLGPDWGRRWLHGIGKVKTEMTFRTILEQLPTNSMATI